MICFFPQDSIRLFFLCPLLPAAGGFLEEEHRKAGRLGIG